MKAAGTGQIINISSIGANIIAPGVGVYGGLKRALEAFTDCLRVELAGSGVKVGIVAPGTTNTEIFEDMKARGQPAWDSFIAAMQPGDVADAVRYMATQSDRTNMARIQVYAAADTH
jgi:NADP-dependent 3-hydroxy acid dehydrogenase YdfG